MSVDFTPEQRQICEGVTKLCAGFGDQYWLERDTDGRFPEEFCKAIADHGYMGIAMPAEYGGAGLGITEAALLMQAISQAGLPNRACCGCAMPLQPPALWEPNGRR